MSAPNHFNIVQQTANQYPQLLQTNTLETIQEFMLILGPRMADADPGWGYLTKTPGEKHITLPDGQIVSVDSFIYGPTQQVVDCLSNAADPAYGPSTATWQEKEKRPENNWYPIKEYDGGTDPTGDCNCQAELQDLQRQINDLNAKVAALEAKPIGTIDGKTIALRAKVNGKFLRVRNDVPDKLVEATADDSQAFEEYVIKDMG